MKDNVLTKEINKIASSSNSDKRIHSIYSLQTNVYGTKKMYDARKKKLNVII